MDKIFPMGLSYYCHLFEEFSTAVHWVCENKLGICGKLVHLLDDFLVMGPSDLQLCHRDPIKQSETVLPCTSQTFLGIVLDSAVMEKRLP